jgi:hypothetical protein
MKKQPIRHLFVSTWEDSLCWFWQWNFDKYWVPHIPFNSSNMERECWEFPEKRPIENWYNYEELKAVVNWTVICKKCLEELENLSEQFINITNKNNEGI